MLATAIIRQLKIQRLVKPKFSAIYVPIKGDVTNAAENDMPFKPIYDPRLAGSERLTATVDAKGITRISEIEIKKIDKYSIATMCEGIKIKKDAPQNKLPITIFVDSVNFFSAKCTNAISNTKTTIPLNAISRPISFSFIKATFL